jgi:hypothetical protein
MYLDWLRKQCTYYWTRFLKDTAPILKVSITFLINLSISEGIVPDELKMSVVAREPAYFDVHICETYLQLRRFTAVLLNTSVKGCKFLH